MSPAFHRVGRSLLGGCEGGVESGAAAYCCARIVALDVFSFFLSVTFRCVRGGEKGGVIVSVCSEESGVSGDNVEKVVCESAGFTLPEITIWCC